MFFSRNSYFKQPQAILKAKRFEVAKLLYFKQVNEKPYLKAYDFFCKYPDKFDGATIVKDLDDIPELDLNAMLHDYRYITDFGVIKKFKWDWEYLQGMNKLGKGYRIGRFFGLILSSVVFTPYKLIFK